MARWIRKVYHDLTAFRVSIPIALVDELGWESCRYVVVEKFLDRGILIGRLPGDKIRVVGGTKHKAELD